MARRVVICGDRNWPEEHANIIAGRIAEIPRDVLVVEGGASGADRIAAKCCREQGRAFLEIPANWDQHGKSAGPMRNIRMLALNPDLVVAFHGFIQNSKGTKDCINRAVKGGVPVQLIDSKGNRERIRTPY